MTKSVQRRLTVLMSFCSKFIRVYGMHTKNYSNTAIFDKVIAKIELCSFFATQCIVTALVSFHQKFCFVGGCI